MSGHRRQSQITAALDRMQLTDPAAASSLEGELRALRLEASGWRVLYRQAGGKATEGEAKAAAVAATQGR